MCMLHVVFTGSDSGLVRSVLHEVNNSISGA